MARSSPLSPPLAVARKGGAAGGAEGEAAAAPGGAEAPSAEINAAAHRLEKSDKANKHPQLEECLALMLTHVQELCDGARRAVRSEAASQWAGGHGAPAAAPAAAALHDVLQALGAPSATERVPVHATFRTLQAQQATQKREEAHREELAAEEKEAGRRITAKDLLRGRLGAGSHKGRSAAMRAPKGRLGKKPVQSQSMPVL